MNKRYYPYREFREDLKLLTEKIDREFDTIIGIARGGLSIALMLGEYYDIRSVYSINTIGYKDTQKLDSVEVFNIPNLANSKRVLIVDDIVDSGDTLIEVIKILNQKYPQIEIITASIFYKTTAKIAPNYYAQKTDEWIEFFWSVDLR